MPNLSVSANRNYGVYPSDAIYLPESRKYDRSPSSGVVSLHKEVSPFGQISSVSYRHPLSPPLDDISISPFMDSQEIRDAYFSSPAAQRQQMVANKLLEKQKNKKNSRLVETTDASGRTIRTHSKLPKATRNAAKLQKIACTFQLPAIKIKEWKRSIFPKDVGNTYSPTEKTGNARAISFDNKKQAYSNAGMSATNLPKCGDNLGMASTQTPENLGMPIMAGITAPFAVAEAVATLVSRCNLLDSEAMARDVMVENLEGWQRVKRGSEEDQDIVAANLFVKAAEKVPACSKAAKDEHARTTLSAIRDIPLALGRTVVEVVGGIAALAGAGGPVATVVATPLVIGAGVTDVMQMKNERKLRSSQIERAEIMLDICAEIKMICDDLAKMHPELQEVYLLDCAAGGIENRQQQLKEEGEFEEIAAAVRGAKGIANIATASTATVVAGVALGGVLVGSAAVTGGASIAAIAAVPPLVHFGMAAKKFKDRGKSERKSKQEQQDARAIISSMSRASLEEAVRKKSVIKVVTGQGTYVGGEKIFKGVRVHEVDLSKNPYIALHLLALKLKDMAQKPSLDQDAVTSLFMRLFEWIGVLRGETDPAFQLEMSFMFDLTKKMIAEGKDPLDFIKAQIAPYLLGIEFKTGPNGKEQLPHPSIFIHSFEGARAQVAMHMNQPTHRETALQLFKHVSIDEFLLSMEKFMKEVNNPGFKKAVKTQRLSDIEEFVQYVKNNKEAILSIGELVN